MGDVDELNSNLGVLLCEDMPAGVRTLLVEIQHQLFNLGGELSIPGFELLKAEAVLALDEALAEHNEHLRVCRSSFCPPAPALRHWPMCAARWRAGRSGRWWRWRARNHFEDLPAST